MLSSRGRKSLLAVGDSETTTLVLQNPRGDGISATGYWALNFERSMIRVYDGNGKEILPWSPWTGGATFLETVPYQKQITVTVVGVSAGEADLKAYWNTWACDIGQNEQRWYSPWHWTTNQIVSHSVMGLMWNGKDITNKHHVPAKAGQRINLYVAGVPETIAADYFWSLYGAFGDYVKDFDPDKTDDQQVTYLMGDDYYHPTLSFVWVAGGNDREAQVQVAGKTLSTWFDVMRPVEAVLTAENHLTAPLGKNGVNVWTSGNPASGMVQFGYADANGVVKEGMTFTAFGWASGFQTCFCQVINHSVSVWYGQPPQEVEFSDKLDGGFPYGYETPDGRSAWDSPRSGTSSLLKKGTGTSPQAIFPSDFGTWLRASPLFQQAAMSQAAYANGESVSEDRSFSMWLMCRPALIPDSIWIP